MTGPTDGVPARLAADVAIIGGGVAGLSLALRLPAELRVILLTKGQLGESNTRYAQGGLAAAVGAQDSPASHLRDTLAAGAGHTDERAARCLAEGGAAAVAWLVQAGTTFDPATGEADAAARAVVGGATLALGNEAAHSHRRILHAQGDATGAEIERALVAAVRARPGVTILEGALATALVVRDGACAGVQARGPDGAALTLTAPAVVLANGGAGRLWRRTSNPPGATADGLALAWRAGAALADLEFVQFHPTVLVPPDPDAPAFLISEAVRGEGAYLRNQAGERFMLRYPGAELAPRDVVARGIALEMLREECDAVALDLRHLDAGRVRQRFPTIAATCAANGLDIARDPLPVAPAAHYFMGGVATDLEGRTTVPGLWAVGEVACTGVHGANRLASNSLLEGLVFGARAAADIVTALAGRGAPWQTAPTFPGSPLAMPVLPERLTADPAIRPALQTTMWERAGLFRDAAGLERAAGEIDALLATDPLNGEPHAVSDTVAARETANMLLVARLIVAAALARRESRGAHARRDYPAPEPRLAGYRSFAQRGVTAPTLPAPFAEVRP